MSMKHYTTNSIISRHGDIANFSALQPHPNNSNNPRNQLEEIRDPNQEDPSKRTARSMFIELVTRDLSREENKVLILYYYKQFTMEEIGKVLDLCESRVSQIHGRVIRRLNQDSRLRALAEELQLSGADHYLGLTTALHYCGFHHKGYNSAARYARSNAETKKLLQKKGTKFRIKMIDLEDFRKAMQGYKPGGNGQTKTTKRTIPITNNSRP